MTWVAEPRAEAQVGAAQGARALQQQEERRDSVPTQPERGSAEAQSAQQPPD